MDRSMTVEEKIRRAEEIYARRHESEMPKTATVPVNSNGKKDIKLLKKMIIQILVSLSIYLIFYAVQNNNYIFSEDFLNQANQILSYDMNFGEIYQTIKTKIEEGINSMQEQTNEQNNNQQNNENAIGGAVEEPQENTEQPAEQTNNEQTPEVTEEEQQIAEINATTTFIKPIEGTISSRYGQREPTTSTVPKNHTGVDIAANTGTKIKSATAGEVVLASEEGDYGKHLKIQIGNVSVIYAHCNALYVKQGDTVTQGQEIAEVGSTGNSTGPHLHFEIRISEKTIDPEKILQL